MASIELINTKPERIAATAAAKVKEEAEAQKAAEAAGIAAAIAIAKSTSAAPVLTKKKNDADETQRNIIDLFGETYYVGNDNISENDLLRDDGKLVPLPIHFDLVRGDKKLIHTKEEFVRDYGLTPETCATLKVSLDEIIDVCKRKLSARTIVYKPDTKIPIDTVKEKDILIYILQKRIERIHSHQPQFLKNLSEMKRPDILKKIIDDVQIAIPSAPANNKLLLFLLYYTWQALHKDPSIQKAWDKTYKDTTWAKLLQESENTTLLQVIEALHTIEQEPRTNSKKIIPYITNLVHILEADKVISSLPSEVESEASPEGATKASPEAAPTGTPTVEPDPAAIAAAMATAMASASTIRTPPKLVNNNNNNNNFNLDNQDVTPAFPGGGLLPPTFFTNATKPIIQHLQEKHPMYSFINDIPQWPSTNMILYAQQLHHICTSITNEKQYGFYRMKHVPSDLHTHIIHLIMCTQNHTTETRILYHAQHCNTNGDFLYFLCLDGNIAFTEDVTDASQKKEQRSVRKFFQADNLYLLYTPKREVNMSYYMKDPYFVYDIDYHGVDNDSQRIHIRNVDTLLNRQDVPLNKYLMVDTDGIVDLCQLELSLVHQLNHLIVV